MLFSNLLLPFFLSPSKRLSKVLVNSHHLPVLLFVSDRKSERWGWYKQIHLILVAAAEKGWSLGLARSVQRSSRTDKVWSVALLPS